MFNVLTGITSRIISNSYINVFQKMLTGNGEKSSTVNCLTYAGLSIISLFLLPQTIFNIEILKNVIIMGLLGSLGNFYIIKALSEGELSILAPINSYKPVIALIFGIVLLNEIPSLHDCIGIVLIIAGTMFLTDFKFIRSKACLYRIFALIFSGTEAIFIKKVILLSDITSAFVYWAFFGFLFSVILVLKNPLKIKGQNYKFQLLLIISVAIMQYSTNYVFSKINVSHALALFQLSTILSVFLGAGIFKEKGLIKKLFASTIMILGAVILII